MKLMYWKTFTKDFIDNKKKMEFHFFKYAIVIVIIPLFMWIHVFLFPTSIKEIFPYEILTQNNLKMLNLKQYLKVYPVIVEHKTYSPPKGDQIPVYSSITSGGSGGITKDTGFHTLSNADEFFISYNTVEYDRIQKATDTNPVKLQDKKSTIEPSNEKLTDQGSRNKTKQTTDEDVQPLPTKIPANYRFRYDFALRWDYSPQFAIASIELKGYKYFRDMLRQIRENFSPPGLNLVWRDNAGVVISQPIKPQVVSVLFLLDYDGTVRDVKVVSSMGQKPVDEACIRVLLNQNFGPPPPEIFEHGNIFGINFIFPPVY